MSGPCTRRDTPTSRSSRSEAQAAVGPRFTTHEGTAVTAYCPDGLPDTHAGHGGKVTIHYDPDDPAVFTPNLASEDRSRLLDITCGTVALTLGVAAVVVGAALL
ncbi:hypothetical protein [Streptomyces tendae]|uniref:DUF3592 domain-containing protein n=1 Tax=Streptomyces tendae TaxID=1932 RepID=A0ABW7S484_STRTE|nr:hypothetical protein RGQ21_71510 [Kitasatospora aureofaciens]